MHPPHPQEMQFLHPSWKIKPWSHEGQIPLFIFSSSDIMIPGILAHIILLNDDFLLEELKTQNVHI